MRTLPAGAAGRAASQGGRRPASRCRGFALLELLVVVFIVGMLAFIAVPRMSQTLSSARIKTISRDVLNILRLARETAITEQAQQRVRVDFNKQRILLTDAFGETRKEYPLDREVRVEGIRIEGNSVTRQEVVDIIFYPEGNSTGAELVLHSPERNSRATIRTDSVTGTAKILEGDQEKGSRSKAGRSF